jgi:hypothetical protein
MRVVVLKMYSMVLELVLKSLYYKLVQIKYLKVEKV